MYYLKTRYYDPVVGRFINTDSLNHLGANGDLCAYNLFAYCSNNPITNIDPNGNLAFPGQIHNIVVNHIANKYNYYKEQTIYYYNEKGKQERLRWGRADLISKEGYIWDVKRDKEKQILQGQAQVKKYADNTWKIFPNKKLHVGGFIESDSFLTRVNGDLYYVTYRYAGDGVIAYDYEKFSDGDKISQTNALLFLSLVLIGVTIYVALQTGGAGIPALLPAWAALAGS